MKTIGLIGGISWESTTEYYRIINLETNARLGGRHSARIVLVSLDFEEVEVLQSSDRWEEAASLMIQAAEQVRAGGAELLLICANTMHKLAGQVQAAVDIPLIHIVQATARAVQAQELTRVGLLGTRYTMTGDFIRGGLEAEGITVLVPDPEEMEVINRIIYDELVLGRILEPSRRNLHRAVDRLARAGAQGVVLGCTELPLLAKEDLSPVPLFDTTLLHAKAAVEAALA